MPDLAENKTPLGSRTLPLIVATSLFMQNLDATVIATALPRIAEDLNTSAIHLKLALTSYLLALTIFIPASGWMADRFGARSVFRLAIIVFAAGSIACAASDTLGTLILSRVVQGIGGSMMVPVGRLIVLRTTRKTDLVGAMAWLTVPALIGPVVGPPLGGLIVTYFDWQWIFWINVPIAALGVLLVTLLVPQIAPEPPPRFDLLGFVLIGPGLAAFLTGVTIAGLGMASTAVILGLIFGGLALVVAYVRHSLRIEAPLVDLRLLAIPTFRISAIGGTVFRIGNGALPFLIPLLFQLGFGFSPLQSGLMTLMTGLGAVTMKFLAQRILNRFGFRTVLIFNVALAAVFLAAPALFRADLPVVLMMAVLFIGGISRSLQFTAINVLAYAGIDKTQMGSATSFNATLQQLSGSVGITVAAIGLQLVQDWTGTTGLSAATFPPVFLLVALLVFSSALWFGKLAPSDGGELLQSEPKAATR